MNKLPVNVKKCLMDDCSSLRWSSTLTSLKEKGFGCRNNDRGTGGHYTVRDIITFETEELENEDIFDTCNHFYGTANPYEVMRDRFGTVDGLHGLWLTSFQGVLRNYGETPIGDTNVTIYSIPSDAIALSDLGDEGILFVSKQPFCPVETVSASMPFVWHEENWESVR